MRREEEMRAVFGRFKLSGQTLKAFGEGEGIAYTTLQYWRRRLGDLGGKEKRRIRNAKAVGSTPIVSTSTSSGSLATYAGA